MMLALVGLAACAAVGSADPSVPDIPQTFEADVTTTVPFLPKVAGHMWYENTTLQSRFDINQWGAKTSIYQDGFNCTETTITEMFGQKTCNVTFLQNPIYPFHIPFFATFVGNDNVNNVPCEHWTFSLGFDFASFTFDFFVDTRPATNELVRVLMSTPVGFDIQQDFANFHAAPHFPANIWAIPEGICPAPKCTAEVDVVLLLDGSGSVSSSDFAQMKQFGIDLIKSFQMNEHAAAFSVVQFSGGPNVRVANNLSANKTVAIDALKAMTQINGGTQTAAGLNEARSQLVDRAWRKAPKTVIVLTDGQSQGPDPVAVAQSMQTNDDITIFSIGVGSGVNMQELLGMASKPAEFHSFTLDGFSELADVLEAIAGVTCGSAGGGCVVA